MCDHTFLDRPDGMHCTREEPHTPGRGCIYSSSGGPASVRHEDDGGDS
jgi:hypothetical protein